MASILNQKFSKFLQLKIIDPDLLEIVQDPNELLTLSKIKTNIYKKSIQINLQAMTQWLDGVGAWLTAASLESAKQACCITLRHSHWLYELWTQYFTKTPSIQTFPHKQNYV